MKPEDLDALLRLRPRIEKIAIKDAKLRTFITQDQDRDDLVTHVYDITYGTVRKGVDNLVVIDDSIVRGTTLKKSIISILDRLGPRRIVVVSSSPQIRYPDCYGIDMAKLGDFIAFKAGRWRSLMLVLVIAPSFASFLLRTYAWKTILADEGIITSTLNALHLLPDDRILNTGIAVVAGLTYNFLPFMILPLYAALEKIDPRLIEAASDLYASPQTAFRKVTWPLSMPGVVAGTLLTFIPAAGDYINAELLGSTGNRMIGNAIQTNFIEFRDYPIASALSFMLMAIILVLVFTYIRRAGTEDLV